MHEAERERREAETEKREAEAKIERVRRELRLQSARLGQNLSVKGGKPRPLRVKLKSFLSVMS